jgi:dsRNA-specific ribonuclease
MEDITQKLQELTKSRRITKLIYKQTNQNKADLFVSDLPVK